MHSGIEEATVCTGKKVSRIVIIIAGDGDLSDVLLILCPCKCDKIIVESRTVSANVV